MAVMYGMILKEITDWDMYLWSNQCGKINSDDYGAVMQAWANLSSGTNVSCFTDEVKGKYDNVIIITDEQISDRLENVAKQTIVWGIHDYKNTIVSGNWVTYFTGYNDIMWKIGSDLFRLGELEKVISQSPL